MTQSAARKARETGTSVSTGRYLLTVGNMGGNFENSLKGCYLVISKLDSSERWSIDEEVVDQDGEESIGRTIARNYAL